MPSRRFSAPAAEAPTDLSHVTSSDIAKSVRCPLHQPCSHHANEPARDGYECHLFVEHDDSEYQGYYGYEKCGARCASCPKMTRGGGHQYICDGCAENAKSNQRQKGNDSPLSVPHIRYPQRGGQDHGHSLGPPDYGYRAVFLLQ